MGTPCLIAARTASGYEAVACHLNGFLCRNGALLAKYYRKPARVSELLALGDLYDMGRLLKPRERLPHSNCKYQGDVAIAMWRDKHPSRADSRSAPLRARTLTEVRNWYFRKLCLRFRHVYVYDKGAWYYRGFGRGMLVRDAIAQQALLGEYSDT